MNTKYGHYTKLKCCPGGPKCCCPMNYKKFRVFSRRYARRVERQRLNRVIQVELE